MCCCWYTQLSISWVRWPHWQIQACALCVPGAPTPPPLTKIGAGGCPHAAVTKHTDTQIHNKNAESCVRAWVGRLILEFWPPLHSSLKQQKCLCIHDTLLYDWLTCTKNLRVSRLVYCIWPENKNINKSYFAKNQRASSILHTYGTHAHELKVMHITISLGEWNGFWPFLDSVLRYFFICYHLRN